MTRALTALVIVLALVGLLQLAGSTRATESPQESEGGQALPGVESFASELDQRLETALASMPADYEPRTEHLDGDGAPKYVNRLILESSPYLLQHAHNPVNWYPWGDEAFERARQLGRPVFLSVGYSTCHWCHVMERESFEDEEIARFLNENYVAIKVDREERPDVDSVYMTAVQLMTRRGGWPMSVWLTPDGEPFYGGTYFPARDGDRGVKTGFLSLLVGLERAWEMEREGLVERAALVSEAIEQGLSGAGEPTSELPSADLIGVAAARYRANFDDTNGGLRRAPKFPSSMSIRLLLRAWERTGETAYRDMAALTLEKMAAGGMFDQIGGGFHRYSTDEKWLAPHFEKMIYDNALLVVAYLEGYQATGRSDFADTSRRVLDYVSREMTAPGGGFYSATDADSPTPDGDSEEGWFFTWTRDELSNLLTPVEMRAVEAFYGVSAGGNFEGRNIFHRSRSATAVAGELGVSEVDLLAALERSRAKLYEARSQRPPPLLDDKILTSWNGLMVSAFAMAAETLDDETYLAAAERAAEFVLTELATPDSAGEGRLLRAWRDGVAKQEAFLDDYAFLIAGLLDLYQASHDPRWLRQAVRLQAVLDANYWDDAGGGYYLTGERHEELLAREKPSYDGAEPSGNSVALLNLVRLAELTTDDGYRARADKMLGGFARSLAETPTARAEMLVGLDFRLGEPKEIVLVAPTTTAEVEPFLEVLRKNFVPNKVVVVTTAADIESVAVDVPFVSGKLPKKGLATAYVCQSYVCQLPTTDVDVFATQLER